MIILRLLLTCLLMFITLSSMNYLIYDRLSVFFVSLVALFIFLLLAFGNKVCLNFFKAQELTQSEDEILINFLKAVSFTTGSKLPDIYVYENATKSCLVLKSIFSWTILVDKSLLEKMSTEQKYNLIQDIFRLKKDKTINLRTFGMSVQVMLLNILNIRIFRYAPLKITYVFFVTPILKIIQSLTNPSVKIKLNDSLNEFTLENKEYFKGVSSKIYFLKLLEGQSDSLYKFVNYDIFLGFKGEI